MPTKLKFLYWWKLAEVKLAGSIDFEWESLTKMGEFEVGELEVGELRIGVCFF